MPDLRSRFLKYGLRATPADTPQGEVTKPSSTERSSKGLLVTFLDKMGRIQVPHGYFKHFYVVSVLSSVFWGMQILSQGSVLKTLASMTDSGGSTMSMSMSIDQIILMWTLLLLQGIRRLGESIYVTKTSTSSMWFLHYLLGVGFYLIMGISVWIEGASRYPSDFIIPDRELIRT